jgi:hypothetical protein
LSSLLLIRWCWGCNWSVLFGVFPRSHQLFTALREWRRSLGCTGQIRVREICTYWNYLSGRRRHRWLLWHI